jgi:hypothetical protein
VGFCLLWEPLVPWVVRENRNTPPPVGRGLL